MQVEKYISCQHNKVAKYIFAFFQTNFVAFGIFFATEKQPGSVSKGYDRVQIENVITC